MVEVDVRGFSCPVPVVQTQKAMEKNPKEVLTVITETATSKENVARLAENRGYSVKIDQVEGDYRLTLTPSGK